jgi:hypothetical protein
MRWAARKSRGTWYPVVVNDGLVVVNELREDVVEGQLAQLVDDTSAPTDSDIHPQQTWTYP